MGPPHAIAPGEVVVSNPNFELKMYGPSATAADPNKRIWISGPPCPVNIWAGMCTTRFPVRCAHPELGSGIRDRLAVDCGGPAPDAI